MTYAKRTTVPVERTRTDIERALRRYGADGFAYGWERERAMVGFTAEGRRIRFLVPIPNEAEFTHDGAGRRRTVTAARAAQQQTERQRWRALLLAIVAKLEAVEAGIATFEDEFLAYVLLPNGVTVAEALAPQLDQVYGRGMPPMLPGVKE